MGCTLKIVAASAKLRALQEPEKVKEFNKAMTKSELNAEENAARQKENYVKELEEKYDEILKKFLAKEERNKKNIKKENI